MIRPATAADVARIAAWEQEFFGVDAWSEQLVAAAVAAGQVLVDTDGYAVVSVADDLADLQRIGVRPERRRSGLGRALLSAAQGDRRMLLEVRADDAGALAFYTAAGFTEIDRRRRYYRDGADALVLERDQGR